MSMRSCARAIPWLAAVLALSPGCGPEGRHEAAADLVIRGGTIVTLDDARPAASALAADDGRIVAVGSDAEIERRIGPTTTVIDLEGRTAVPGFIESHAHLRKIGRVAANLELADARSWEEIVERVRRAAEQAPPGAWIFGRGWHQEKWDAAPEPAVRGFPVHDELSRASPDHPVHLRHASGHASLDNARAMERVGITASTPDPPGGEIVRDAGGRPTGVFLERAEDPLLAAYEADQETREHRRRMFRAAVRHCLARGVTSFHDAGATLEDVDILKAMADDGSLDLRVYAMLDSDSVDLAASLRRARVIGYGDHRLTVRAVKAYIDGALGARGAWLLEPYDDAPDTVGHNLVSVPKLERIAELALEHDYQLCVHAIGDRGNREVLDVYERVFEGRPGSRDLRWRVEHAQHLHPDDVPRFARLGVIAAVQAIHCVSDGPWVPARIGLDRAREGAYVWRSLLDSGATLANGTDAPVEPVDPIRNFHAAVTRRLADGSRFFPEQRMTREEALRSATIDAARAAFEEDLKGTLTPGKLADVVVLSDNLLDVPEDDILGIEVVYTIVGGRVVHGP